jgi:hypothetical protein
MRPATYVTCIVMMKWLYLADRIDPSLLADLEPARGVSPHTAAPDHLPARNHVMQLAASVERLVDDDLYLMTISIGAVDAETSSNP